MTRFRRSARFEALPGYPLAEVPEIRRKLREQGVDVIDLGAGDADLAPPPGVVRALQDAAGDPDMSRYPFQLGLPAFRERIAAWMERRFGVGVDAYSEVLPLIGSKDGLAHLPFAFMDEGDVALIPDPGYQAYRGGVVLAGGTAHLVPLRPENDFRIRPADLPADVLDRVRIVYLNYPNNPTTAVAPESYLREMIDFCRERSAILVYDNAYSEIAFDGYVPPSILEYEGARDVAIEFHSLSKTYNMTGWRIGWAAGSAEIIGALSRVKTFMDTGVFKAVQAAGIAALDAWEEWLPGNVEVFRGRRDAAVDALRAAGFEVESPKAAMYLWVAVPGGDSNAFALRALREQGVVIMPGRALGDGGEGFFRVALTVSAERLVEAAGRLGALLD